MVGRAEANRIYMERADVALRLPGATHFLGIGVETGDEGGIDGFPFKIEGFVGGDRKRGALDRMDRMN